MALFDAKQSYQETGLKKTKLFSITWDRPFFTKSTHNFPLCFDRVVDSFLRVKWKLFVPYSKIRTEYGKKSFHFTGVQRLNILPLEGHSLSRPDILDCIDNYYN